MVAQDISVEKGFAIYQVVGAQTNGAKPFKYEMVLSGDTVTGYFAGDPLINTSDVSSMKAANEEVGTVPASGLRVKFDRSQVEHEIPELRKNDLRKGYLICFGGIPRSVIKADKLCKAMEPNHWLFVLIPIKRSAEFEELERLIKNVMAFKMRQAPR